MNLLSLGFPMSYILFYTIIISTIIIIGTIAGIIVLIIILGMISIGMIKITPLLDKIHDGIEIFFPETFRKLKYNITNSFKVREEYKTKKETDKTMYLFHPHGALSVSYYFHSSTDLTEWQKEKNFKVTISRYLYWLPFSQELTDKFNGIPNLYWNMKKALEEKNSLYVIPGGTSEIPLTQKGKLRVKILNRMGIFRLALETGTSLTPVLTYGENELYELLFPKIQEYLQENYHIVLPIPSYKSIRKWCSLLFEPFDKSIETYIGQSIQVEKIEKPTEKNIIELRNIYIEKLQELYKKTKPESYSAELEII